MIRRAPLGNSLGVCSASVRERQNRLMNAVLQLSLQRLCWKRYDLLISYLLPLWVLTLYSVFFFFFLSFLFFFFAVKGQVRSCGEETGGGGVEKLKNVPRGTPPSTSGGSADAQKKKKKKVSHSCFVG